MKKLILIAAVAGLAACTAAEQTGYTVSVNVKGDLAKLANDTLVLKSRSSEPQKMVLVNGKGTFTGELTTPRPYSLSFAGKRSFATIFLENDNYTVEFDAAAPAKAIVRGGTVQSYINKRDARQEELSETMKLDSLSDAYNAASEEEKAAIVKAFDSVNAQIQAMEAEYVKANPTSPYALAYLVDGIEEMPLDSASARLAAFSALPEFAENEILKDALATVETLKGLQPGMQTPDFTQNDVEGNPVTLSEVYSKNKVTMVDFWASWCGPCRGFNPTLVKIYEKYHKKGFEIVGVSMDNKQDAWEKGIKDDHLTWIHVSDLKGWKNAVGAKYYVHSIPQNIMVDQNGKILIRKASEEEIIKVLEENL